ncbi:MAG: PTS sugar transporter subunit IIA [Mariniblastus sp.]
MPKEDFDINSLATYLHLTPEQVRKMADRSRLPGRRVSGQWRFSQAEIHQWFEERIGLSDEEELTKVEHVLQTASEKTLDEAFHIPDLLAVENVYVPFLARTKSSVIQRICSLTSETGKLWDPVKMAEALQTREELHPTALENGVALLHPRRPMSSIIGEPFLALGITSSGIPFGGPRGCLTDIFFLLGSTSESVHLRLLARLSRLIQQPEFLDRIRETENPQEAWDMINEFDANLDV